MNSKDRMKISLRREDVDKTRKPLFMNFNETPETLVTKSQAKRMNRPVTKNEEPTAYVFSRAWNGYLPLYERKER